MITTIRNYALIFICALSTHGAMLARHETENTVLWFNLYDVICKPQHKASLRTALEKNYRTLRTALNSVTADDCVNPNDYVSKLAQNGFKKESVYVRDWIRAYQLNQEIVEIINAIHEKGYDVTILSSSGNEYELSDFAQNNPIDILKAELMLTDSNQAEEDDTVDGPSIHILLETIEAISDIFSFFIDEIHMIYLDSEHQNSILAQKYRIEGVHFTSAKQLKKDLQRLGIL